jgi:hypothetical protein
MPEEETVASSQESEHELSAMVFAVGRDPYCVWDWDLEERNFEYLESLDPFYFDYVARTNAPNLEADDPQQRRRAAIAIRTAYHHGLECFFGLLFASLQAPGCVVGWMQAYTPAKLRRLVGSVDPMLADRSKRDEMRAYRQQVLPYIWLRPRAFFWHDISKALNRPTGEEERVAKAQKLFADLWRRFAKDFLNESFVDEYNSIKHGFRAEAGGFYFSIGPEEVPGEPPPAEKMHLMGASEHGSSFFMPRTFVEGPWEKETRPRLERGDFRFRVRRHALNWDPKGLCDALNLISCSINNVRAIVQTMNGADSSDFQFLMPTDEGTFRAPLGRPSGISFSNMDALVLKGDVQMFEKEEIKNGIRQQMDSLRGGMNETASTVDS